MLNKFVKIIQMTRPGNASIAAFGIAVGYIFSGQPTLSSNFILRIIAGTSALAFGNLINDIVDAESDKINHPNRPLPTGEISKILATLSTIALALLSLTAGYFADLTLTTALPIAILTLYSLLLKGTPLLGNITVSTLTAYTLIYGAIGGGDAFLAIIFPAASAFFSNLCREIIKDLEDAEGDIGLGIKTTASLHLPLVKRIVYLGAFALTATAVAPALLGLLGVPYAAIVASIVAPLTLLWLKDFWGEKWGMAQKKIKLSMIAGIVAILIDYFLS